MYLYSISIVIKVYNLQMLTGVQGNRDNVSPRHKAEFNQCCTQFKFHSTFNFDNM